MDKNRVFISVIVPVFKVEKYLHQCVDSVLNQTFKNFELILVNDGSPDNCPEICDSYKVSDSRVKVIHQTNKGQVKARKAGLKIAKGEYVFFVDSDDWLELNALEIIHNTAVKNNADIVTFDAYFNYSHHRSPVRQSIKSGCFDKEGIIKNIYPKMIYSGRFFYFGIYAAMWNKVFRRSILTPNMVGVDERIKIGEDGVTTFASFLDANKICVLGGQYLYNYRDNNVSITRSYLKDQFDNTTLLIQSLNDINKKKNVYDLSSQIEYYFMYNVYSIFIEEFYYRYKKSFGARYKYLRHIANDPYVLEVCEKISVVGMQPSFSRFFILLKQHKFNQLIIITIYIALKKRAKVLIKKWLKRY